MDEFCPVVFAVQSLMEDNHPLSDSLRTALVGEGLAANVAYDGLEDEEMALFTSYHLRNPE